MPFDQHNTHHSTFGDDSGGVRDRLPTLFEVLNLRTRAPVDLWSFYVFMREQYRGVEYLDFWLDVVKHLSLCRNYVRGLRQSLLASERDPSSSRTSSVLLDNLIQDGTLDDTDSRRLSAFLRGEEVDGNQGNLSRLSALLENMNPKEQEGYEGQEDKLQQPPSALLQQSQQLPQPSTPSTPTNRSSYHLHPPNTSAMAAAWAQEKRRLSGSPIRVVMSDSVVAAATASGGSDSARNSNALLDEKRNSDHAFQQQHQYLHRIHTGSHVDYDDDDDDDDDLFEAPHNNNNNNNYNNESFYSVSTPPPLPPAAASASIIPHMINTPAPQDPRLQVNTMSPLLHDNSGGVLPRVPRGVTSSTTGAQAGPFSTPRTPQQQQQQHLLHRQSSRASSLGDGRSIIMDEMVAGSSSSLHPPGTHGPIHSTISNTHDDSMRHQAPAVPERSFEPHSNSSSFVTRNDIKQSTHFILVTYFIPGAEREIVLPQRIMRLVRHAIEVEGRDDPEVFDEAREYVFQAMQREAFRSFLVAKALGNTTPFGSIVRLVIGLLSTFAAFWTGFILIFLDWKPKSDRIYLIIPFAFAVYGIMSGLYNLDPILALLGYSETGPGKMIRIREPYVRQLLIKRALFVAAVIVIVAACFIVLFTLVPGRRL
ncbi:uncharacterized protein SAPINGB_P004239 [Magnusiomyces paraingens]|uniref:RGS domain-containing protein n=1 Tax=Magnusiomyces paraingens TaxID=2606893 RepID=A0A5E8BTG5_9ASCO|nr:uncharacterized protein SAPINGB_P004239 [Saprochaete ingens]VVT54753.1 unnamed protein product [Saprochaete ingens]